ncbi:MAG: alpha/beta hydrolase [Acidobacteriota bacterium]|nr:alpha/beta hydrolase [Acidobacteriota bacterium]
MSSALPSPERLHFVADAPVAGLAVAERRVARPEATLICVHGGLDRGRSFARLARRADHFDVVAYDRRGYQGSRALGPSGLDDHVADLICLMEREASTRPVVLFGHSFGGVVTFGAALARPELVRLVVNYESPLPWVKHRPSSRPPLTDDAAFEAEQFFRRVVSNGAWERLSELERESRRLDGPALVSDLRGLRLDHAPYDLAQLVTPASYVHGDGVLAPYYRALGVKLQELNAGIEIREIAHANHGAHLSHPDEVFRAIEERWEHVCASV